MKDRVKSQNEEYDPIPDMEQDYNDLLEKYQKLKEAFDSLIESNMATRYENKGYDVSAVQASKQEFKAKWYKRASLKD